LNWFPGLAMQLKNGQSRESHFFKFMISNDTTTSITDRPGIIPLSELDFCTIDGDATGFKSFALSMLRIGRILLAKAEIKAEIRPSRFARLMTRHRYEIPCTYTPKEIRYQLISLGELRGGGILIQWDEYEKAADECYFTIQRLHTPEELAHIQRFANNGGSFQEVNSAT